MFSILLLGRANSHAALQEYIQFRQVCYSFLLTVKKLTLFTFAMKQTKGRVTLNILTDPNSRSTTQEHELQNQTLRLSGGYSFFHHWHTPIKLHYTIALNNSYKKLSHFLLQARTQC